MTAVSANYRQLTPEEVPEVAARCADAWKHPDIPRRQYDLAVKPELEKYMNGQPVAPFDTLVRCWRYMDWAPNYHPSLLDVGASSGYYSEVLRLKDIPVTYTGVDYSPAFQKLAKKLYPGIRFDVADAASLPYEADAFDVVLSSACIMHIHDYEKAIAETARVARRFAIFSRTSVCKSAPTKFFEKTAYDIPCLEIHFNESELLWIMKRCGLELRQAETVFWNNADDFGHRTYLLESTAIPHYPA